MSNFNTFPVDTLKWFVYVGNGNVGPISAQQLREGFLSKTYTPQHYVWSQVMKDWMPISSIPELMAFLTDVPGLSPPALELDRLEPSYGGQEPAATAQVTLDTDAHSQEAISPSSISNERDALENQKIQVEELDVTIPGPIESESSSEFYSPKNGPDNSPDNVRENTEEEKTSESTNKSNESSPFISQEEESHYNPRGSASSTENKLAEVQPVVKLKSKRNLWIGTLLLAVGLSLIVGGVFLWWKKNQSLQQKSGSVAELTTGTPSSPTSSGSPADTFARAENKWNLADLKLKALRTVPFLSKWISPLSSLPDVSEADFQKLKNAILQPLEQGAAVEMALSNQDRTRPALYLASNLPEKAELLVHVAGNPETLLGSFSFYKILPAVLTGGLAKTSSISQNNGAPLVPGEYAIVVTESPVQPDGVKLALQELKPSAIPSQISSQEYLMNPESSVGVSKGQSGNISSGLSDLSSKKVISVSFFFFGGTKDTTYETRLKEFHDTFKSRYESELQSLKQTISFLTSQWVDTNTKFDQLKKQRANKVGQKNWAKFHATWSQMDLQLKSKLSAAEAQPDLIFPQTKALLQGFANAVSSIHEAQNGFFVGQMDLKKVTEILQELQQKAEVSQKAVADKISQIDGAGQSTSGLPKLPSDA